jgi:LmbE family N-acetylglucosaminyl deacetylase
MTALRSLLLFIAVSWLTSRAAGAAPARVLWIAAHPDDEILAAPLLADLCVAQHHQCTLLVFTRGEAGHCLLSNGCRPHLSTVRAREEATAAQLLHSALILWRLPDGGGLDHRWDEAVGGTDQLLERLEATLNLLRPDRIITFDPRHGSTCHGDHRRVGELVVAAAQRAGLETKVHFVETLATLTSAPFAASFAPAATPPAAGIVRFAASTRSWSFVPRLAWIHRSQFPADAPKSLRLVRRPQRAVFTAPAAEALASDEVFECE